MDELTQLDTAELAAFFAPWSSDPAGPPEEEDGHALNIKQHQCAPDDCFEEEDSDGYGPFEDFDYETLTWSISHPPARCPPAPLTRHKRTPSDASADSVEVPLKRLRRVIPATSSVPSSPEEPLQDALLRRRLQRRQPCLSEESPLLRLSRARQLRLAQRQATSTPTLLTRATTTLGSSPSSPSSSSVCSVQYVGSRSVSPSTSCQPEPLPNNRYDRADSFDALSLWVP